MAYTDVDLDIFDTDDLIEELCGRVGKSAKKSGLTEKQINQLRGELSWFFSLAHVEEELLPPGESLLDFMKKKYLQQVAEKYTLQEIEAALPVEILVVGG